MPTVVIAAVVLILLAAPDTERDVIWFKDGRPPLRGVIRSETDTRIVLLKLTKGRKGAIAATAGVGIPKSAIRRIDRMPDATRRRLLARIDAFAGKDTRRAEALAKIRTESVRFLGMEGLRTKRNHFEVLSTCDDEFVREVTYYLDEVFAAYKQSFDIQRNADRRIRVYMFADRAEYIRFQQGKFGGAVQNPAFYHIKENFIAAHSMVQREEAARIAEEIRRLEREAQGYKDEVDKRKKGLRDRARAERKKIRTEAEQIKRKIRKDRYPDKTKRQREVEQAKKQAIARVDDWERKAKKELAKHTQQADAYIAQNRRVVANNRRTLAIQNRRMFELLFHEGFHAFARNFLWSGGVPRWLDEGLASYYEMSAVEAGELIHGASHPAFVALLKKHLQAGQPLGIQRLFGADAAEFLVAHGGDADRSNLHYALSWAVVHYLKGRVPRARLAAYVVTLQRGADSKKAFEAMMGRPLAQVEAELRAHLEELD